MLFVIKADSYRGSLWAEHFQGVISLNSTCELIVPITLGGRPYFPRVSSGRKQGLKWWGSCKGHAPFTMPTCLLATRTKTRSDIFTLHFVGQTLTVKHILKGITGHGEDVRGSVWSPPASIRCRHRFVIHRKLLVWVDGHTGEPWLCLMRDQKRFLKLG